MAGGSILDLILIWHVAKSTPYQVYASTYDAITETLIFDGFPYEKSTSERLSDEFAQSRQVTNALMGCVGVLDGIAIKIAKPRCSYCVDPTSSFHCKGYYALPVQAICHARYRFIFFSAKCSGPTHDLVAFSVHRSQRHSKAGSYQPDFGSQVTTPTHAPNK